MDKEIFGTGRNGETVFRVTISGGGLTAHILTWGAIIQDLRLEGHKAPLVLGFENMDDYLAHSPYFGATPGRSSNRIADGRFMLDGKEIQLECNEKTVTHLHGGSDGIAKQNWKIEELTEDRVVLSIVDPAGRAGYPGNCSIRCTYFVAGDGALSVSYEATTDQPTIANLCQHSYFNLDGKDTILDHQLMIAADTYLPTDERQIPTGEIRAVKDTPFDFRTMKPIRCNDADGHQVPFDHNFCLSSQRLEKRSVIHAHSPSSGVNLWVSTTEPGVQFYSAFKLNVEAEGLEGRRYGAFAGFCLETQIWPDSVHHKNFPSAILRPGQKLRQATDYIFSKA